MNRNRLPLSYYERLKSGAYTCIAQCGKQFYVAKEHGILPLIQWIQGDEVELSGAVIYDRIVGKAAAMLFRYAKIKELHTFTISALAKQVLEEGGVPCFYEQEVPYVINRKGDGMCPMEQSVLEIEDVEEGYRILCEKAKR